MTSILKNVYKLSEVKDPFILPNCQEDIMRLLYVFNFVECTYIEPHFYSKEAYICFISKEFILDELK